MDDEVLEMRRICAALLGIKTRNGTGAVSHVVYIDDGMGNDYAPDTYPAQAFELLCWLRNRGRVLVTKHHLWFTIPAETDLEYDAQGPAELRLAIMRATVKMHEGGKK